MPPFRVRENPRCPACDKKSDGQFGERRPEPGDITICLACDAVSRFDHLMVLHLLTADNLRALPQDLQTQLERTRRLIHDIRGDIN